MIQRLVPLAFLGCAVACNGDSGDQSVGRSGTLDGRDGGAQKPGDAMKPGPQGGDDDTAAPADPEVIRSQVAEVLGSDEFREAACRVAGVVAHSQDPSVPCDAAVNGCLNTVGTVDASAFAGSVVLSDETLDLADCNLTAAEADACLADVAEVIVDLSQDVSCDSDAGVTTPTLGPELLLAAPSCLQVALKCPALLELVATAVPM